MKRIFALAFLFASLTYGCATDYAARDSDDDHRYCQRPQSYAYECPYEYPYGPENNYYPDGYRYFNGG